MVHGQQLSPKEGRPRVNPELFNMHFLLFSRSRLCILTDSGRIPTELGQKAPSGKNEIEYFSPVLLHQEPEITIHTKSIGSKSFILEYDLNVNEKLCTSGSSVLVCYDSINKTSINVPDKMRQVLEGLKRNDN